MLTIDEINNKISDENLNDFNKLNLKPEWLLKECRDYIEEESLTEYDLNELIKTVINEYIDELLYRENKKYDLDRE